MTHPATVMATVDDAIRVMNGMSVYSWEADDVPAHCWKDMDGGEVTCVEDSTLESMR